MACYEPLLHFHGRGGRRLRELLNTLQVDWVSASELARQDPHHLSLLNINTPEDYRAAQSPADQSPANH
jgi:molybdopterin-guanine dinucleotide biosynthesis protein A